MRLDARDTGVAARVDVIAARIGVIAARVGVVAAAMSALVSCGGSSADSKHAAVGTDGRPVGPRVVRRIEAAELLPADLDLVVRVDLARMTSAIGPAAVGDLSKRAGLEGGESEPLVQKAMERASVVWIGLRLADIDAGDRVLVIEGDVGDLSAEPPNDKPVDLDVPGVSVTERAELPKRSGTARVVHVGERMIAFVSPVEVDSVARVLLHGPDERRGDPSAEGFLSLDLRPRRLPASLERRFPSISAIIAGTKRIRAAAVPIDDGVRLDAEIIARNKAHAERAMRFLAALRDNVQEPQSKELMKQLSIEPLEDTIRVRWVLPRKTLADLMQPKDRQSEPSEKPAGP